MNDTAFRWSDAWLLHAVAVADRGDGADLADVIAAGDGINHALFTDGELHNGLRRLLDAALLERREQRLVLAGPAVDAWQRCRERSNAAAGAEFRRLLNASEWTPGPMEAPVSTESWPSAGDLQTANAEYERRKRDLRRGSRQK
jgi:hypothetical protein